MGIHLLVCVFVHHIAWDGGISIHAHHVHVVHAHHVHVMYM